MTLAELLDNPDYTEANAATKRAIFEKYSKDDENYTGANSATKAAIREKFGVSTSKQTREVREEPETALQTFGRSAASIPDTALNAVTGLLDMAAYPLARAYYGTVGGLSPEEAAARAQRETTSPKDVVGRALGVAGTPGYENAPQRQLGNYVGEALGQNVIRPLAESTGLPEQDIGSMVNTGLMAAGPAVPKVAGAVKPVVGAAVDTTKGLASVAASPLETARGVVGGFTGTTKAPGAPVKPWETASARMPIGETYIPANVLEQYRAGTITAEQAQAAARPTSELPADALRRTQGMVPFKGQEARAAGEHFGAGYRDPYSAAAEIGVDLLTAGGIPSAARLAYKGYDIGRTAQAYNQLGKAGFSPLTPAEMSAFGSGGPKPPPGGGAPTVRQQAAAKINTQALPPDVIAAQQAAAQARVAAAEAAAAERRAQAPATPEVAGPVAPTKPQSIFGNKTAEDYAAIERMVAESRAQKEAALAQARTPTTTREITPMESPESRAAARAEAKAETPLTTREKLDKTMQSAYNQVKNLGKVLDKKLIDETLAGEGLPAVDWSKLGTDYQSMSIKDGRKAIQKFVEKETGISGAGSRGPTQKTLMKAANEKLAMEQAQRSPAEVAKELADMQAAIERRKRVMGDKYRAPGGDRFEMMTGGPQTTFKNKAAYDEQRFNDKLAGEPTLGSYIDNGKLYEYELNRDFASTPRELQKHVGPEVRERVTDLATGKIIKGEPRALTLREKIEAAKKKGK